MYFFHLPPTLVDNINDQRRTTTRSTVRYDTDLAKRYGTENEPVVVLRTQHENYSCVRQSNNRVWKRCVDGIVVVVVVVHRDTLISSECVPKGRSARTSIIRLRTGR